MRTPTLILPTPDGPSYRRPVTKTRLGWVLALCAGLAACGTAARRHDECGRFADWSNGIDAQVEARVPNARLTPDVTNDQRAVWYRDRAAAIRAIAAQPPPFTDERVLGYARRFLASYEPQAAALDAEAAGWAANDGAATTAAQTTEMQTLSARQAVVNDWVAHCND